MLLACVCELPLLIGWLQIILFVVCALALALLDVCGLFVVVFAISCWVVGFSVLVLGFL